MLDAVDQEVALALERRDCPVLVGAAWTAADPLDRCLELRFPPLNVGGERGPTNAIRKARLVR